jgi:hypothetical protein
MGMQNAPLLVSFSVTAEADGLSEARDLQGGTIVALMMPATWTAATITLLASDKIDGTFYDVYDDGGNLIVLTVAQQQFVVIAGPYDGAGLRYVKLRSSSGSSVTPVQQGGVRVIRAFVKHI